ncbi:MAG: sugar phosphate nucleotidyltransferase [Chlorobiaceae bacterium]
MAVTTAIILAGGLGTRLRSAVPDLPKPMAPIGGRPFLEYQIDYWIKEGVQRFVLSVGYRHEVISDYFGIRHKGAEIDYVIESRPLGTGGGLLLAAQKLNESEHFLLLNGDTYFAVGLEELADFAARNDADWCFSLFSASEEGRYMGMGVSPEGAITALRSGSTFPGRLANGGVYLVKPSALAANKFRSGDKVSLEDDIFLAAMESGQRLFGLECTGTFIDIGVPEDYHRAQTLLVT